MKDPFELDSDDDDDAGSPPKRFKQSGNPVFGSEMAKASSVVSGFGASGQSAQSTPTKHARFSVAPPEVYEKGENFSLFVLY